MSYWKLKLMKKSIINKILFIFILFINFEVLSKDFIIEGNQFTDDDIVISIIEVIPDGDDKFKSNFILKKLINSDFFKSVFVLKSVSVNSHKALRIIDFIGDKEIFKYLYNTLNSWLKKFDVEYIDFLNYGIENEIISKSGLRSKSNFKNLIVPNYFEPFVAKNNKLFFAFKTNHTQDIVICKGDGDQERPNQLSQKNMSIYEN